MRQKKLRADPDLTVAPANYTDEEANFVAQFIAAHKASQNAFSVQKIILNLLQSGKLTVAEIAEYLNVSISTIQTIQKDMPQMHMASAA